jgi:hypothetical protein
VILMTPSCQTEYKLGLNISGPAHVAKSFQACYARWVTSSMAILRQLTTVSEMADLSQHLCASLTDIGVQSPDYSCRRVRMGSILVAWRAGT